MKNLKRALSFALATVMVIGMMVVGAGAAFTDAEKITNDEAVDVMYALGVINGKGDGSYFDPEATLTRAEAAKIITYMLLGKDKAEALGTSGAQFTDVPAGHWAETYIGYCANMGIISGYNNEFNPTGELTGLAFGKMLLVALGYNAETEGYTGTSDWGINVAVDMVEAGIDLGDDVVLGDALSRDNAAQLAFNTLTADMVKYNGTGTTIVTGGTTIVTGAGEAVAVTNDSYEYRNYVSIGTGAGQDDTMQFCEKYFPKLKHISDTDAFMRDSKYWFLGAGKDDMSYTTDIDTKIGEYADTADYTILVTRNDKDLDYWVDTVSKSFIVDETVGGGDTHYTQTYLNADEKSTSSDYDANYAVAALGDSIELFMETDGKTIHKVVITRYTADVVNSDPDADVSTVDKDEDVKYYTSFKTNVATKDTEVPGFDAATYVKNAVVAVAVKGDGTILDSYVMTPVKGAITAYNAATSSATKKYTIDGKAYSLNASANDVAINGTVDFADGNYALYLDNNGYVLYTKVLTANAALEDVYYVVATYYKNTQTYGASSEYKFYAQVVDMAGVISDIEISPAQYAGLVAATPEETTDYNASTKKFVNGNWYLEAVSNNTGYTAQVSGTDAYDSTKTYYNKPASPTANEKVVAGLYSFEDVDKETYKKAVSYNPASGSNLVGLFDQTGEVKATATDIGGFKVNADTKYILVKGSLGTLKVATYTGGIAMSTFTDDLIDNNEDIAVYTKDANGNKVASYMILLTSNNKQNAASYTDLLYCSTTTGTVVNKGVNTVMYNLKGEKVTVYTKNALNNYCSTGEFYKYNIDADGYYTFETAETQPMGGWDTAFTKGVFLDEVYAGLYGTKISSSELSDKEAANAKVIDLRGADAKANSLVYTGTIDTLNKLHTAAQKGTITIDVYATKENGVELIFVTSVAAPTGTVTCNDGSWSAYAGKLCVDLTNLELGKDVTVALYAGTTRLQTATLKAPTDRDAITCSFRFDGTTSGSWAFTSWTASDAVVPTTVELYVNGVLVDTYALPAAVASGWAAHCPNP